MDLSEPALSQNSTHDNDTQNITAQPSQPGERVQRAPLHYLREKLRRLCTLRQTALRLKRTHGSSVRSLRAPQLAAHVSHFFVALRKRHSRPRSFHTRSSALALATAQEISRLCRVG